MIYYCEDGPLSLWRFEYGYTLKLQGSKRDNSVVAAEGHAEFMKLTGWTDGDMAVTDHLDFLDNGCNYPV